LPLDHPAVVREHAVSSRSIAIWRNAVIVGCHRSAAE
jgi:hypothetical protein